MSAYITKCPLETKSALVEDQIGEMKQRTLANFCTVNIQTKAELGLELSCLYWTLEPVGCLCEADE